MYFITICIQNKECLLGDIKNERINVNEAGKIVNDVWHDLPARFPDIVLDEFIIMPNHIHGIVGIFADIVNDNGNVHNSDTDIGTSGLALSESDGVVNGIVTSVGVGLALPNKPDKHNNNNKHGKSVQKGNASITPTLGTTKIVKTPTLGDIIRVVKSISAIQINRLLNRSGQPLWQRNYYEHIIRNEDELNNIRQYIINNPINWSLDEENPNLQQGKQNINKPNPFLEIAGFFEIGRMDAKKIDKEVYH